MRKIIRQEVSYRCGICKTDHSSKAAAMKCEKRQVELKKFRLGEKVTNIVYRCCNPGDTSQKSKYYFKGKIIKIIGPSLLDEDTWCRVCYDTDKTYRHIFEYEVAYTCPRCHIKKTALYYSWELKSISA
ncbi:MAG: hypothetical protein AAB465_03310 [Patescibacteria group bacterium]